MNHAPYFNSLNLFPGLTVSVQPEASEIMGG